MLKEIWFKYVLKFNPTTNIKISNTSCTDRFDIYFRDVNKTSVWDKYDSYLMTIVWGPTFCLEQGKDCYQKLKEQKIKYFYNRRIMAILSKRRNSSMVKFG